MTDLLHETGAVSLLRTRLCFLSVFEVYIPYNTSDQALAFGMGAAEQVAYDHVQKRLAYPLL